MLDEPVDGLDPVMRRQVWSLVMEDVAEEGMTVLVSSHNLRELEDVCDHVGIMQRGRCLLEKSVSELQETTTKVLLALPDGTALPEEGLDILHRSSTGKLQTLILRGREEDNLAWLEKLHPLFMDSVPLTLEEIFTRLERKYPYTFVYSFRSMKEDRFNLTFGQNASIEEIMDIIARVAGNLDYQIVGDKCYISIDGKSKLRHQGTK